MKNTTLLFIILILIVGVGAYFFGHNGAVSATGDVVSNNINPNTNNGEIQKVVISEKNSNYYPNEIHVKAGKPVSLSLDSSVVGCLRSFTIRDLGLGKVLRSSSDSLDFTPSQKGTYTFACSMGMGYGKLFVE